MFEKMWYFFHPKDWQTQWLETWDIRHDIPGVVSCMVVSVETELNHLNVMISNQVKLEWRGWSKELGLVGGTSDWDRKKSKIPTPPENWHPKSFEGDYIWELRPPLMSPPPKSDGDWELLSLENRRRERFLDSITPGAGRALAMRIRAQVEGFPEAAEWIIGNPNRVRFCLDNPSLVGLISTRIKPGRANISIQEVDEGLSPVKVLSRRLALPPRLVKAVMKDRQGEAMRKLDSPMAALENISLKSDLRDFFLLMPHEEADTLLSKTSYRDGILEILKNFNLHAWKLNFQPQDFAKNLLINTRFPENSALVAEWLKSRIAHSRHLSDMINEFRHSYKNLEACLPCLGMERLLMASQMHLDGILERQKIVEEKRQDFSWDIFPALQAPNGIIIKGLKNAEELTNEGVRMKHCLSAHYAISCFRHYRAILSLSDPGQTKFSTADIKKHEYGHLYAFQHVGERNSVVSEEHADALEWWLNVGSDKIKAHNFLDVHPNFLRPYANAPLGIEVEIRTLSWEEWRAILATRAKTPLDFALGLKNSKAILPMSYHDIISEAKNGYE